MGTGEMTQRAMAGGRRQGKLGLECEKDNFMVEVATT